MARKPVHNKTLQNRASQARLILLRYHKMKLNRHANTMPLCEVLTAIWPINVIRLRNGTRPIIATIMQNAMTNRKTPDESGGHLLKDLVDSFRERGSK